MNQIAKTDAAKRPEDVLRSQLTAMSPQFAAALPSHIKPDKFQRVVMTVVQQQPDLMNADRRSLLASCMKCAADGLVPDGREAALVIFKTKNRDGTWTKAVQYMPMLTGILKRARNSGEIAGVVVNVVYENDTFIQKPDDFDHPVEHRPPPLGTPRGAPIGAYALVKLKDGTIMHDVMDREQIDRVRDVSRSKDSGPWVQWWDQMARKTVFRRLSKYLPMDAEVEPLLRRDDEIGETIEAHAEPTQNAAQLEAPASKLDSLEATLSAEDAAEAVLTGEVEEVQHEAAENPDLQWLLDQIEQNPAEYLDNFLNSAAVKAKMRKLSPADAERVNAAIEAARKVG